MRLRGKEAYYIAPALLCATLLMTACNGPTESVTDNAGAEAPQAQSAQAPPKESSNAQVGNVASGFVLPDADGKSVDLNAVLGTKPVVLVFYRGMW